VSAVGQAFSVELLKARRSRMPLFTALAATLAPLAGGFFMVILKDPELARRLGLISAKAQIVAGAADWYAYLGVMAQAMAMGGMILFGFIASWVFGREYSDRTLKDLLALPTPRRAIVLAKFAVIASWAVALTALIGLFALVIGAAVRLPPGTGGAIANELLHIAIIAALAILLTPPVAFVASAGRGYLPPMGFVILMLIAAMIVIATGWGEFFPWAVPALYAGMAGPAAANMGPVSYWLVILAAVAGLAATVAWWVYADQTR
jgi:ABC-2 type transport system permease protein